MAIIKISELRPTGSELFQDSESYLNELSDREMSIFGGKGKNKGSDPTVLSINTYSISINSQSVITNYYDIDIKIKVKNK